LLLRVALADQLTRAGEVCPLILDDPTPHFDGQRTAAMLDLLLQIAESRQVILFRQETKVLAWAERQLAEPQHRLWRLPGRRVLE
jgi:exonuclease SbcC